MPIQARIRRRFVPKHAMCHFSTSFDMHHAEEAFSSLLTIFEACGVSFKDMAIFFLEMLKKASVAVGFFLGFIAGGQRVHHKARDHSSSLAN